jgi:hypothetical protein
MLDLKDPISATIGLFLQRKDNEKLWERAETLLDRVELAFSMALAASIAFCTACGTALVSHSATSVAIGYGMIAAAVAMFGTFQASRYSKGMTIALIQQTADNKLDTPMTTIDRK